MADEKVNVSPEESKTPEAPAPSGPGEPPAPEHTEGPAVPGGDQAAPSHAESAAGEHTPQTVLPGMGEDAPAPSGKVINLSDIQAADKGGKEASAPAPDKKAPEADKPPKRRGRPPKEQAGPTVEKKSKAAEPRTGRPSKVDKTAREEAPPSVRDKVSRGGKKDKDKETGSGGVGPGVKAPKGKPAPVKEAEAPAPEIKLPPTPEVPPRPVEQGKIVYLKLSGKCGTATSSGAILSPVNWQSCWIWRWRLSNARGPARKMRKRRRPWVSSRWRLWVRNTT